MPLRTASPETKLIRRLMPGVPDVAMPEVARTSRLVTYRPGETVLGTRELWSPGAVADGTLRFTIRSNDGREATLVLIERGMLFGLHALFEPEPGSPAVDRSVVAVEKSTVVLFETGVIARLGQQHPAFAMHIVSSLVEWGNEVSEVAAQLAFMTVRQRVAGHLLKVATTGREASDVVFAPVTQQQLADAVGSVREVVARTLHDMRLQGLIEVSRARVTVVDRGGLLRVANRAT
jgi:CRP/FNR family cyclic AMP-dependent transcriptional regulator